MEEAIVCLERALAINPLFTTVWWTLGAACLKLEWWDKALAAFVRVVGIDMDVRRMEE